MTGQFEAYVLIGVYFFSLLAFMLTEPDRETLVFDDEDADGVG